jgi:CRP/FNR family cyclic AMP-dependent transcriptional regulator
MKSARRVRDLERFSENRLFEGIDAEVLKKIAPKIGVLRMQPGEIIFREGDPGDSLYLVGEGSVKISRPAPTGEHDIVGYVDPGNFFGATALLAGEPRSGTAVAAAPALIGAVKEETFQQILELAPSRVHRNFLRAVTDRMRRVNAQFMRETVRAERLRVAGALANAMIQDLKNPVCIARCCSDLIASESTDPQLRELSRMLTETVNSILGMTLDLLDYTRGSVSVSKRPVSIWRLLDELNRRSLHLLPAKKIGFVKHVRYQGNIDIDLGRFARALGNVIDNSIHAMPARGVITFTSDLVHHEVVLRLSDTGVGISSEMLLRLYEPFEPDEHSHRAGTGLAIVKAIVEAHDGKISIASVPGKGTTVDIRLPKPAAE